MKKKWRYATAALILCIGVAVGLWQGGVFTEKTWQEKAGAALEKTSAYILEESQTGSVAEDTSINWAVMALCRSTCELPAGYLDAYFAEVETMLQACGGDLIGDTSKFNTEYSRLILALSAAGANAADFAGFDLTAPLADFEQTVRQGINGAAYALLALDAGSYACPVRQDYVDYILEKQMADGGWALSDAFESSDTDVTAIVLQALAKYRHLSSVETAIDAGLTRLSQLQRDDGGYATMGAENPESSAQVILALCELGVSLEDARFVKNGKTPLDAMLGYQLRDGSFAHLKDNDTPMAVSAYQSMMALVSLLRCEAGSSPFYTMP